MPRSEFSKEEYEQAAQLLTHIEESSLRKLKEFLNEMKESDSELLKNFLTREIETPQHEKYPIANYCLSLIKQDSSLKFISSQKEKADLLINTLIECGQKPDQENYQRFVHNTYEATLFKEITKKIGEELRIYSGMLAAKEIYFRPNYQTTHVLLQEIQDLESTKNIMRTSTVSIQAEGHEESFTYPIANYCLYYAQILCLRSENPAILPATLNYAKKISKDLIKYGANPDQMDYANRTYHDYEKIIEARYQLEKTDQDPKEVKPLPSISTPIMIKDGAGKDRSNSK